MFNPRIRYELAEILGEGSQGRVFKAHRRDPSSGLTQTVATKILHSKTAIELWRREFESLSRVRSAYCVQVFAFERIGGKPALILEYVDGVSLFQLARTTSLSSLEIEEILAQLEHALLDLNRYSLFHGDLSPHNILVDSTGRIRLLDFGLANGAERMTPEFAAPERLQGAHADLRSDIFSLGRIQEFLGQPASPIYIDGRVLRALEPSPSGQNQLAQKANEARRKLESFKNIRTRTQVASVSRPLPKAITAAAVALALFAPGASQSLDLSQISALQVKTERWHYFTLDGAPLGYSPLNLPLDAGKTYRLEWTTSRGRGVKQIRLQPGLALHLTDRDFSH